MPNYSTGVIKEIDPTRQKPNNKLFQETTLVDENGLDVRLQFVDENLRELRNIKIGDKVIAKWKQFCYQSKGRWRTILIGHGIKKIEQ